MKLTDKYNRIADYLRIGVTDRCNLRCQYCMPSEGIDFLKKPELLTYEEIVRLGRIFRGLGIRKVRLTGGEPFVRKDIMALLSDLVAIFPAVHITTNASLLHGHIPELKHLGVAGLNISIDSLSRERFAMITRRDQFDLVMDNILSCLQQGLPTKLNVVVMKGVNDMELLDFVEFGITHAVEVRFIEAMPFNADDGNRSVFLSAAAMVEQIAGAHPTLHKVLPTAPSAADLYLIEGKHRISVIPAYTRSLCHSCNRIRLTPQGEFLTCLYASKGMDLKQLMRAEGTTDEAVAVAISAAVLAKKKDGYEEEALQPEDVFRSMTTIGG